MAMQVLTHDGATVRGRDDIMSKLTSIVELHKAFGMSYRAQYTDVTPWLEVYCNAPLGTQAAVTSLSCALGPLLAAYFSVSSCIAPLHQGC
jgi:hypothetical protein